MLVVKLGAYLGAEAHRIAPSSADSVQLGTSRDRNCTEIHLTENSLTIAPGRLLRAKHREFQTRCSGDGCVETKWRYIYIYPYFYIDIEGVVYSQAQGAPNAPIP